MSLGSEKDVELCVPPLEKHVFLGTRETLTKTRGHRQSLNEHPTEGVHSTQITLSGYNATRVGTNVLKDRAQTP